MKETKYWILHFIAGFLLLFIAGFHFLYTHIGELIFKVEDNISKEMSQQRDAKLTFMIFFIVLLGIGLYHGLYGLKNILFELIPCENFQKLIAILIVLIGLSLFIFGTYSAIIAHNNAIKTKVEVTYAK